MNNTDQESAFVRISLNKRCLVVFQVQFWENVMLMMFYMNVFYVPTLKQVVGQYKNN